jgi:predicted nucleotidyltransferase
MSTKQIHDNLSSALFGKTKRALLALFFSNPEKSFYLRQIARLTGTGQGSIQRELEKLTQAGIIERQVQGRQVYFRAKPDCPVFKELKGLILKTAGLVEVFRSALSPLSDQIDSAFVYGSQARGQARASSDIDLLIIGRIDELELHWLISPAEGQLNRPVNYTFLTPQEFNKRRKEKGGFLSRVLGGEKIFIIGKNSYEQ